MVWWTGLAVSLAGCLLMLAQVIFAAVPVGQRWPAHILMLGVALVAIGKLIEFHTPQAQAALSAMRLPRRNDRKAPMKRSSSFKSQMLGFYFGINDLRGPDGVNATDEQLDAAYAINARAYQLLGQWLPRAEAWVKKDEQQPEITFSPYEICEESIEIEDVLGYEAFSFWLFSYHQVGPKDANALQCEVVKAYKQAAADLGGQVKFLRLDSVVTEEVKTTTELVVDAVERVDQAAV